MGLARGVRKLTWPVAAERDEYRGELDESGPWSLAG
jgi:hypothetical protein